MIGEELRTGRLRFSMVSGEDGPRMRMAAGDLLLELREVAAAGDGLDLPTWQEVAPGGELVRLLSGATGAGYFSVAVTLDASAESATIEAALRFKTPGRSPAIAFSGAASTHAALHGDGAIGFGPWRVAPLAASQLRVATTDPIAIIVEPSASPSEPPGTVCWGCRISLAD